MCFGDIWGLRRSANAVTRSLPFVSTADIRIHNRKDLIRLLGIPKAPQESTDALILLEAYRKWGGGVPDLFWASLHLRSGTPRIEHCFVAGTTWGYVHFFIGGTNPALSSQVIRRRSSQYTVFPVRSINKSSFRWVFLGAQIFTRMRPTTTRSFHFRPRLAQLSKSGSPTNGPTGPPSSKRINPVQAERSI